MRPLLDRVIVRTVPPSEQIGLIHIPEKARMKPQEGVVVAIGPKVSDVKIGDTVLFGKWNHTPFPGLENHSIIWQRDILVVLG